MKNLNKLAKNMLEMDKLIQTGKNSYEVDGEIVNKIKDNSKTRLSCSCKSCTFSKDKDNICSRKIAVIVYEYQDFRLKKLIREGLEDVRQCEELGLKIEPELMANYLNDLRSFV